MESSFLELKSKQVINTVDGKCLGYITDVIFDVGSAKVLGFVVPVSSGGFWGIFKGSRELFIPYNCVYKIGVDVVLVELYVEEKKNPPPKPPKRGGCENIITLDNGNNN